MRRMQTEQGRVIFKGEKTVNVYLEIKDIKNRQD
jgi:hypothetical protein